MSKIRIAGLDFIPILYTPATVNADELEVAKHRRFKGRTIVRSLSLSISRVEPQPWLLVNGRTGKWIGREGNLPII